MSDRSPDRLARCTMLMGKKLRERRCLSSTSVRAAGSLSFPEAARSAVKQTATLSSSTSSYSTGLIWDSRILKACSEQTLGSWYTSISSCNFSSSGGARVGVSTSMSSSGITVSKPVILWMSITVSLKKSDHHTAHWPKNLKMSTCGCGSARVLVWLSTSHWRRRRLTSCKLEIKITGAARTASRKLMHVLTLSQFVLRGVGVTNISLTFRPFCKSWCMLR
mmetsp:Transcript_35553/g.69745  ORF Transcript_35553/g.69745 Transcript_35553/m.69745 type:complete len:221 (-) Transcript_35553:922-1584(-)